MRSLALLVTAGCSFTHGALGVHDDASTGSQGTIDAPSDGAPADMTRPMGPPVFDSSASSGGTTVSNLSWSHTATGDHRLVVVGVSWGLSSTTITNITYGGTAMTLIGSKSNPSGAVNVAMYMMVAPPTGAQTVAVTFSGNVGKTAVGGSASFMGVDQTTPIGPFASATGGAANISVAVMSGPNELVVDTVSVDSNPTSLPSGSGQSQLWEVQPDMWGAASTKAGGPMVMMTWTESGGTDPWAQGAVSIRGG